MRTGKLTGEVTGLAGVHGVALDARGKYGYISDGAADKVRVFDRVSHQVVMSLDAGKKPDYIIFEPVTARVFAFNGTSYDVTVIDANTNTVVTTFKIPGEPEGAQADGKGAIFLAIEDTHQLVRIDAAAAKVTAEWSVAPCERPTGLAMDREHERLFTVCENREIAVLDAATGAVVATPTVGSRAQGAGFDSKGAVVFSSNTEGTLTVLSQHSPNVYEAFQTLPTQPSTKTMAVDPSTGTVYIPAARFGPKPVATSDNPSPKAVMVPDSFVVLVVRR